MEESGFEEPPQPFVGESRHGKVPLYLGNNSDIALVCECKMHEAPLDYGDINRIIGKFEKYQGCLFHVILAYSFANFTEEFEHEEYRLLKLKKTTTTDNINSYRWEVVYNGAQSRKDVMLIALNEINTKRKVQEFKDLKEV